MIRYIKRYLAIRSYVRRLSQDLPRRFGKRPFYSLEHVSQALQREGCVPDLLPFYHTALNQELLGNSALDCGLAFPHARLNGVRQLRFALGRADEPIIWGPKGSWPVQLVFLLAVPATEAANYLPLLASLARLGQQPELLAELRGADTVETILGVLRKIRIRLG